ncbi:uncharacterized protein LOC144113009 [Amblyomma americanum]
MYSMEMNNFVSCTLREQDYFDLLSGPLLEDDDKDFFEPDLSFQLPNPEIDFESDVACWVQQSPVWGKNLTEVNSLEEEVEENVKWVSEVPGWIKEVPKIESEEEDEVDVVSVDDDKSIQSTEPSTPTKSSPQPTPEKSPKKTEGPPVVSSSLLDRMKAASAKKRSPILIQPPERNRPPAKNDAATNTAPCPAATPDHDYCTAAKSNSKAENHSSKHERGVVRRVSRSPSVTRNYRSQKRSLSRRSRSPRRRRSRSSSSSRSSSCGSSDGSVRQRSRSSRRPRDCRSSWRPQHRHREPRRFMPSPPRRRIPDQKEERRVIYVGNIPEGTTRLDLRERFARFGHIEEVSVHFRDHGDNYGFVTFLRGADAYEAVEHGNDDPKLPRFDLCFGGRRQFCRTNWADLDSQYEKYYYIQREPHVNSLDFDSLLQAAKTKIQGHHRY